MLGNDGKINHNEPNFLTLRKIPEQEKIEIIQTGFQLRQEGKILSLRDYYEGKEENSLLQLKGYSLRFNTIQKAELYQELNPKTD